MGLPHRGHSQTVEQAGLPKPAGADYLGVGAVFPSPTKKNAIRITTGQLREICASVSIPCVAIGGISRENLPALAGAAWTALPWSPPSSPSRISKPPAGSCVPWRNAL